MRGAGWGARWIVGWWHPGRQRHGRALVHQQASFAGWQIAPHRVAQPLLDHLEAVECHLLVQCRAIVAVRVHDPVLCTRAPGPDERLGMGVVMRDARIDGRDGFGHGGENTPRHSRFSEMSRKKRSTLFSHDAGAGVKCMLHRGCLAKLPGNVLVLQPLRGQQHDLGALGQPDAGAPGARQPGHLAFLFIRQPHRRGNPQFFAPMQIAIEQWSSGAVEQWSELTPARCPGCQCADG
jgi:hypothetical protein